jgi:hypothetical protein
VAARLGSSCACGRGSCHDRGPRHENRPGTLISDTTIFATHQNAGVRAFDIGDPYRPRQTAVLVPPPPATRIDPRPGRPLVIQTTDVTVTADGVVFCTDYNAGLTAAQYAP